MQKKQISILVIFLALFTASCAGVNINISVTPSLPKPATKQPIDALPQTAAFKTPEDAITAYFAGIEQNDPSKILQACAITEMSENFKFDLWTERLGGVMQLATSLSPSNAPLYVELNKIQLSDQLLRQVRNFAYALLSSEPVDFTVITKVDPERVNKFMADINPKRLAGLAIKKITLPNKTLMQSPKYIENATKSAKVYGADELTERVVLFSFEQSDYVVGFTLLRYGENWKIQQQSSPLGNTNALGTPQKTTEAEFDSKTSGD